MGGRTGDGGEVALVLTRMGALRPVFAGPRVTVYFSHHPGPRWPLRSVRCAFPS